MKTALLISPHLDDVAFSCGGTAALLADQGWHTILLTVFTRSVVPATGFALACQLDKGLPADTDYMALRRMEDLRAAELLGCHAVSWMDLPEAPHRGYGSAEALFGDHRSDDTTAGDVAGGLRALRRAHRPNLILAPQALGHHVDHQVVRACVQDVFGADPVAWYRDAPYAMRDAAAPQGSVIAIGQALARKIAAAQAYESQIPFQFGSPESCADALTRFALLEGQGTASERLLDWPLETHAELDREGKIFVPEKKDQNLLSVEPATAG